MQKELSVCSCGFTEDNHMFRHDFKHVLKVQLNKNETGLVFELDIKEFPVKSIKKCGFPGCSGNKALHVRNTSHNFQPVEVMTREIRLCIPNDILEQYSKEGLVVDTSKNEMFGTEPLLKDTLTFVAKLKIDGLSPTDTIAVFDENDYDLKYVLV